LEKPQRSGVKMSQSVTFSLQPNTLETITNVSSETAGGNRSKFIAELINEFAEDYRLVKRTLSNAVEIAPHLKTLQGNCRQIHTGRTLIRDWDKEIMSILKTGREVGKVTDPENMYLFHEMVNRLIVALQEEEARGWEEPEHEGIKF
jgi:hypothetical protein